MCLITTQKEAMLTTEDIVCYKSMFRYDKFFGNEDYNYRSILKGFNWKLNVIYETNFTFIQKDSTYTLECSLYDKKVREKYFFTWFNKFMIKPWYVNSIKGVAEGFHAFLTPDRPEKRRVDIRLKSCDIVTCVIPSGSLVFYDKTGLIVSNKMKLIGKYYE